MSATRYDTAQNIINRAMVELGLGSSSDVFASVDPKIVQLRGLLNSCGQDLVESFEWEYMRGEHSITTSSSDTGSYPLPDDFGYMINQTNWNRTDQLPMSGTLTAQQWAYLQGRGLGSSTIYMSFRIMENTFNVFPDDPVPDAKTLTFEYISRYWVILTGNSTPDSDAVTANGDVVLFKPTMIVQYLRYKFLDAKGFDSSSALGAFTKAYLQATGGNKGAAILNAGGNFGGIPLLDYRNIPVSNYGG
jgi:hypothetical protein